MAQQLGLLDGITGGGGAGNGGGNNGGGNNGGGNNGGGNNGGGNNGGGNNGGGNNGGGNTIKRLGRRSLRPLVEVFQDSVLEEGLWKRLPCSITIILFAFPFWPLLNYLHQTQIKP